MNYKVIDPIIFSNEIESIAIKKAGVEYDEATKPKECFSNFEDFREKLDKNLHIVLEAKGNINLDVLHDSVSVLLKYCRSATTDFFEEDSILQMIYDNEIVQNLVEIVDISDRELESIDFEIITSSISRKCIKIISRLLELHPQVFEILSDVCFIDTILNIWNQELFDVKALTQIFILMTKYIISCDTAAFIHAYEIGFINKCCETLYQDTEDARKQYLLITNLLANYFSRFTAGTVNQSIMDCFEKFLQTLGLADTSFDQRQVLYSLLWKWIQTRIIPSSYLVTTKIEKKRIFLFIVDDVAASFLMVQADHIISQFASLQLLISFFSDPELTNKAKFSTLPIIKFNVIATTFDRDSLSIDLVCHFLYVLSNLDFVESPPEACADGSFFQYIMCEQNMIGYIIEAFPVMRSSNQETCVKLLSLMVQREIPDEYGYMMHNGVIDKLLEFMETDDIELRYNIVKGLLSFARFLKNNQDLGWDYFCELCEDNELADFLLEHTEDEEPEYCELFTLMEYKDE